MEIVAVYSTVGSHHCKKKLTSRNPKLALNLVSLKASPESRNLEPYALQNMIHLKVLNPICPKPLRTVVPVKASSEGSRSGGSSADSFNLRAVEFQKV